MNYMDYKIWVILFRRAMIKLSTLIANQIKAPALISGESIGQVASQTLSNIRATSDATNLPIIRPLAGSNKEDIIHIAEKIGTYKISVEPYDDCCSFFIPTHPETKADLKYVQTIESQINLEQLYSEALDSSELINIKYSQYYNKN